MSDSCKICANSRGNKYHTIKEMMFGTRHSFDYLECGECGTIQIVTPPDDLSPYYPDEAWKTYGVHWAQLDAPRHIFIHSIQSIKLLAEQTGFEVSQIIYDSDAYQFWASEAIMKGVPSTKAKGMFTKQEMRNFNKRARKLNTRGGQTKPVFTSPKSKRPI